MLKTTKLPREVQTLLKPYVTKFLFCVHPDFFYNNPKEKQVNTKSLQTLNALLNSGDVVVKKQISPSISIEMLVDFFENRKISGVNLEFYHRNTQTDTSSSNNDSLTRLNSVMCCFVSAALSYEIQNLYNSLAFLHLCRRIGIPVDAASDSLILKILKERSKNGKEEKSKTSEASSTQKSLREIFAHEIRLSRIVSDPISVLGTSYKNGIGNINVSNALTTLYKCVYYENDDETKGFAQTRSKLSQKFKWWGKIPIIIIDVEVNKKINDGGILLMHYDWPEKGLYLFGLLPLFVDC
ncbi:14405_t:CDS:2 [Ambispora leptoticha]|uniref:14405_t:CDS:1 n=1 Tax=Ambispora leptoticha TaxID=144679 RepID=A0A9N8VUM5_9GLOM|nr:14405_t:CDS:2 [Ambispora leptoticha]